MDASVVHYCSAAYSRVVHGNKWVTAVVRLLCKSWACPICGPKKAGRMRQWIQWAAKEYELTKFLTLTLDPKKIPRGEDGVKYLRKVWAKFRTYVTRKNGEKMEFISVVEPQKSGVPHLHVLISKYLPQKWISSKWDRLGGGRIVYIKKVVDIEKIGGYLGKYLTKNMLLSVGQGVRRVTTSRGIKRLKDWVHTGQRDLLGGRKKEAWERLPRSIEEYYVAAGNSIIHEKLDEEGAIHYFTTSIDVEAALEKSRYVYPRVK